MSKRIRIPKDVDPAEANDAWHRHEEKQKRNLRRRLQDKTKGSRSAETKIKELTVELDLTREKIHALTKMLRFLVKILPPSLREEYEVYRAQFNAGNIEDVHPE